jgi:5-methylcytosine-specific restriction endonuclease McrA
MAERVERCPLCLHFQRIERDVVLRSAMKEADKKRRQISSVKREQIHTRDGQRCLACGSTERLTLDHIIPLCQGGTNHENNPQTLCVKCNTAEKGGKTIDYRTPLSM